MISAEHQRRFEEALLSPAPSESLYALAESLRDEGVSQIDLFLLFSHFHEKISSSDDASHDPIVDTMDEIWGGPWAKGGGLFPTELSYDDVRRAKGESP